MADDRPISTGLMRGLDLALTKRQIGLREKELEQQQQQIDKQEKWKKINTHLGILETKGQPDEVYDRSLQSIFSEMGITGLDFSGQVEGAKQEALGIRAALQKNKDPNVARTLISDYVNRYRGIPKAQEQFAQTAQELDQLRLTEADQGIAQELQPFTTPQERINYLNKVATSDSNQYRRARANQILQEQEKIKDISGTKEVAPTFDRAIEEEIQRKGLTGEAALNFRIQKYAEAAGQKAGETTKARKQVELNSILSADEANKLGVPYGTTMLGALGKFPLSQEQRSQLSEFAAAETIIDDIANVSSKVNTFKPGLLGLGRAVGAAKNTWGAITQTNEDAAILDSKVGELSLLVRAMGEKGTLATKDVDRVAKLVPSKTDTTDVAKRKIQQIREFISEVKKKRVNSIFTDISSSANIVAPLKESPKARPPLSSFEKP